MHVAARNGHKEIVLLLLQRGADLHVVDKDNFTPLDVAEHYRKTEVVTLLKSWFNDEKKNQINLKKNFKKYRFSNRFRFKFNNMRFFSNGWLQKGAIITIFAGLGILGYRLLRRR